MKEIQSILAEFERRRGEPLALATLVRAYGSSYRRPGARMLISTDRSTMGVLSGGCLEEEVTLRAQDVIATGVPKLCRFDTRLRYGCNGEIEVFIEKLPPELIDQIAVDQQKRRASVIATRFERSDSLGSRIVTLPNESDAGTLIQTIHPPLRLFVVGQGPDSAPLRAFARTLGWEMIELEEAATLPNEVDEWTAAIVKTHNYGRDFAALARLFPMGLRYLALLGPRRRRDQLLHAVQDAGILRRSELFAPAGLDLGAESPAEIALTIVAEIQTRFSGANAEPLRERKVAIHLVPDLAVA